MSIAVTCPSCDKEYKVKDDSAGKKLRCKNCQTVIPIPEATEPAESDPWDAADDGAEAAPVMRAPPRMRKSKPKSEKSSRPRRSSGTGMPATVIVSICANGLMILLNLFGIVDYLMEGGNAARTGGRAAGTLIPVGIEIAIITGLVGRRMSSRRNSIILDGLGLVLGIGGLGMVLFLANRQPQLVAGGLTLVISIASVKIALWITDMVVLLSPSAQDWCNQ
jgi:predicted Zn finger-like uncharacterized protein